MWAKILLLFFIFSFSLRLDSSFNQDLGRHIKLGEIITKTLSVPSTNLFSYTNPDFPFINTHWLFGVVAFFFDQTVGLEFFLMLKILIFLLSIFLILKVIPDKNQVLLLPIGYIFLHILRERLDLRPEIFSFLFTALTYYILNRGGKLLVFLPIIQLIWVNIHIYFFVGLFLQAIFLVSKRVKKLAYILIASIFASLINPNGLAGFLYPLTVNQTYGYSIVENQTIFFLESINFQNHNFFWVKIAFFVAILSFCVAFIKKRFNFLNTLLICFGLALALLNIRSFPYLVLLTFPVVLVNFGEVKKNIFTNFLFLVSCFLIVYESFFYLNGDYYRFNDQPYKVGLGFEDNVKKSMEFVLSNKLPTPLYNNFDIGSYVIYKGYPKYQVFVDGRPEAYPKEFFQEIYIPSQSDYKKFKELEIKYNIKTVIFSHTDQTPWGKNFLQNIIKDPDWTLVFIDDFMTVFVKGDYAQNNHLIKIDLSKLSPNHFKFDNHFSYLRLGMFLINNGFTENGGLFIQKANQVFPQSPVANSILGNPTSSPFFW